MTLKFIRPGWRVVLLLAVLLLVPAAGHGAERERVGQSYIKISPQLKKGTVSSLKNYVKSLLAKKYVSADKLYDPPLEDLEDKFYVSVTREKAVPIIAGGVSSFSGNDEGLAAALYDGTVRIWSGFNCAKLRLPGGGGAGSLGYGPGSPSLAATSSDGSKLYAYDLKQCARIPGEIPVAHAPVKMMAASRTGDWLGFIDNFNTLVCGPVTGPLSEIRILEGTPILLGYTPAQGILIVVEASGKITKTGMKNMSSMDSDQVPGGPFKSARMAGYTVCLTADDGHDVYWDLRKRGTVKRSEALREQPSWIYERDGALVYFTGVDRWKVTEHLGMPMFIVSHSVKKKLLRVRDLDGITRYYSMLDGKEFPDGHADDWKLVTPRKGVYKIGAGSYRLYDPVYQKGTQRLYCRYIAGKGFYLWWEPVAGYKNFNPHPMKLPVRECVLAKSTVEWVPLVEGEIND
ncbi:WD40 repeat domain-containing protein [Maridesulfovibrio sp.]|uniref:WD40 repeat domain-containing protein n=1 Tax=Maridesulfovibrio sp. TaxID=2795000 RepID=UPI002A18DA34|nr:WD40 repeat domain-containing protein [Maridesulfovibrio sp.]